MGYLTELNTLIGLPKGFDVAQLAVGKRFTITLERERAFPLRIAMIIIDKSWNFYGYGVAHSAVTAGNQTTLEIEVLTMFSPDEQALYKSKFLEAARMTGEVA